MAAEILVILFLPKLFYPVLGGDAMQINEKISNETSSAPQITGRKIYQKPHLEMLGDLRAVTLGGSVGLYESGHSYKISFSGLGIDPNTGQPKQ